MILFGFLLFVSGCSGSQTPPEKTGEEKIVNVLRIFMHTPNTYSVMMPGPQDSEIKLVTLPYAPARFFVDVPVDEHMWVLVGKKSYGFPSVIEFHIHSQKDIEGAGWNHGKGGSGQTIIVE